MRRHAGGSSTSYHGRSTFRYHPYVAGAVHASYGPVSVDQRPAYYVSQTCNNSPDDASDNVIHQVAAYNVQQPSYDAAYPDPQPVTTAYSDYAEYQDISSLSNLLADF